MKEEQLREMIRSQINKKLQENPERFSRTIGKGVGSRLGGGRSALDRGLDNLNVDALARLSSKQKVELLVGLLSRVGISSSDFNNIKARVTNTLRSQEREGQNESINENEFDLQKAKGGVTSRDLGGASAVSRAKPFLKAINGLQGGDKARAIGYVLAQMGVDANQLDGMKTALKTQMRKYKK